MAAIAASAAAACANAAAQRGRWRPLAQRRRRRSRHHSAHPLPLPLHHVVVVLLLLLAATVSNLVVNAALEVRPPAAFVQCQPATVAISAKGNVTVSVRLGHGDTHNVTHLGVAPKEWRWSPVDLPAGTNFTLVVRDERPRNATTTNSDKKTMLLGTFSTSEVVQLPAGTPNITDCFNTSRTNTTSSPTSGTNTRGKDASSSKGSGGSSSSKRRRITQVAVVSALLGGLLFLLLILVGTVVVRRRAEAKQLEAARAARGSQYGKGDNGSERRPSSEFGAVAAGRGMPHDAGWKYMANLVGEDLSPNPSLARSQYPPASSRRGSGSLHSSFDATFSPSQQAAVVRGSPRRAGGGAAPFKTNRYDNDTVDVDLPSYGHSQYDARIAGGEGRVRGADTAAAAPMSPAQLPQRYQHSGAETAVGYELRDDPLQRDASGQTALLQIASAHQGAAGAAEMQWQR